MRTVPVNHSAGPFAEGWEPQRFISMRLNPFHGFGLEVEPGPEARPTLATGHLLELFGVAGAFDFDPGGGFVNVFEIGGREFHGERADVFV